MCSRYTKISGFGTQNHFGWYTKLVLSVETCVFVILFLCTGPLLCLFARSVHKTILRYTKLGAQNKFRLILIISILFSVLCTGLPAWNSVSCTKWGWFCVPVRGAFRVPSRGRFVYEVGGGFVYQVGGGFVYQVGGGFVSQARGAKRHQDLGWRATRAGNLGLCWHLPRPHR